MRRTRTLSCIVRTSAIGPFRDTTSSLALGTAYGTYRCSNRAQCCLSSAPGWRPEGSSSSLPVDWKLPMSIKTLTWECPCITRRSGYLRSSACCVKAAARFDTSSMTSTHNPTCTSLRNVPNSSFQRTACGGRWIQTLDTWHSCCSEHSACVGHMDGLTLGWSSHRSVYVGDPASEASRDNEGVGLPAGSGTCFGRSWPNNSIKPNWLRQSAYFER